MTQLELDYMKRLLALLKEQHSKLEATIKSVEDVLRYERSTHVSLKCLEKSGDPE